MYCASQEKNDILSSLFVLSVSLFLSSFFKGDITKHISPKFFYTHELYNNDEINVQQIRSSDNIADLFTKALPTITFKKLVHQIGIRQVKDLQNEVLCHY